ncbi:RRP12-like protein [Haliotis rufescens]|uniref:RRP12-like protein n=1 Tax=Haliotis rufescens TaxID=6454 RepID=UPI00201F833E|nr:RRP12-like protein [Haliotis rufescens]
MGYKLARSKKNKGRTWKKGQSSNSNPESKKFREAAKHRFFNQPSGQSSLTVEALSKHDEEADDDKMSDMDAQTDTQTVGAKTFNTWATNWTDCTNKTFSKVQRYWSSNSAVHKEVLAVLAAVTEVIKQQGGQETETEYFAALMTALETAEGEESMAAIGYLLSLVMKRVPVQVLRSRFSQVAKQILDMLAKYSDASSTSLLKSLLLSLAAVLRVQEVAVWSNASTQQIYTGLLTFITHRKPKVRKSAHHAVNIVLKASLCMTQGETPPPHHPVASLTAKYCVQQIEESGGTGDAVDSLHVLTLLKEIIGEFAQSSVKVVCETILKVMTVSNVLIRSCGLQALHGLFSSQPKSSCLSAELNAQIITAMYDYQPSESDSQPVRAWLAVMERAHVNLYRLDPRLCVSHLPKLVSACMACLLSDRLDVVKCASATLKLLLQECLAPSGDILTQLVQTGSSSPVHKIVKALETGLSYQYHSAWGPVLQVWAAAFQAFGKQCHSLLKKCLLSMADLRETPHFAYRVDLDIALGSAVKAMGPRLFLDAVPLQISGDGDDPDFPRSWLIPVFRDNVSNTELGFFTSYFLPLAARFRQRAQQCAAEQNVVAAKSYEALQQQIWSLLPGFCKHPTDIAQSFKGIAKVLGSAITERPDLRMKVLASLRSLITQNVDNDSNKAELARFGKNFLPILFNLFTQDQEKGDKAQRLAVLETVRAYIQICDQQLVVSFFDKSCSKMDEEDSTAVKKLALTDLMIALLSSVGEDQLKTAFDLCVPNLTSLDKTLQKKSYRILQEICSGKSPASQDFTRKHLKKVQKLLVTSLAKSSPASKAPRLRCLISLLQQLEKPHMEFFLAVVPEAMLCTKEIAERARVAAYDLLMVMADTMVRWYPDKPESESVGNLFKMVLAGLAGSPQMISGTLLALTRLLYGHKDKVSSDLLDMLVESVCLLLSSKTREVVKSGLGFIKVMLSAYTETRLAGQLKTLVSSLVGMKEDCRHHCHTRVKQIYSKLIRKFGYDTIHGMTPARVHKLLNNIRKTQERAKRKKLADDEEESDDDMGVPKNKPENVEDLLQDTDSEMEEDQDKKKKKAANQKSRQGKGAWLKEGGDDQIVDFLDASAAKKVLATKPGKKTDKTKKDSDFKMSADGRLVVTDMGDDKGEKMDSADEDDLDDLFAAFEGGIAKRRRAPKRKLEADSDEEEEPGKSKYKAGGGGIHRPLTKTGSNPGAKGFGKEYKAKKAGGDVKKTGKHDPYAYVALNRQTLNRRKQAKMQGQFQGLVRGARKGAAKGTKNKKRNH